MIEEPTDTDVPTPPTAPETTPAAEPDQLFAVDTDAAASDDALAPAAATPSDAEPADTPELADELVGEPHDGEPLPTDESTELNAVPGGEDESHDDGDEPAQADEPTPPADTPALASTPAAAPAVAIRATTPQAIDALADLILDPERDRPVIGVTAKPSEEQPFVDADALAARLEGLADVWVVTDSDLNWALTDALPDRIDVYGGAVRAWTPIAEGTADPFPSDHPQWTVFNDDEGARVSDLIVAYVELTKRTPLPPFGSEATGTITTVRKAGAELDLDTGHPAFVSINHIVQHGEIYHAADALQEGQQVTVRTGAWHPQAGRVSVSLREYAPDPWERIAEVYEPGMLIEGGVTGVTQFGAFVELMPGVEGLLHKSKIADEFVEYVDDYVREGDRITVRLLDLDPRARKAAVGLRGVPRGAKPELPAAIFPGGPPWLPMPDGGAAEQASNGGNGTSGEASEADVNGIASAAGDTSPGGAADKPTAAAAAASTGSEPAYAAQLRALTAALLQYGGSDDAALANVVRDALERGIATLDARLDEDDREGDEPSGETGDATTGASDAWGTAADDADTAPGVDPKAIAELRTAAGDLIDALRAADTE